MKPLYIILGVLGVLFAGVAVLVLLVVVGIYGISSREPTEAEKDLLVSASSLEEYGAEALSPDLYETYVAKRNIDGSLGLEYEYDSDNNPNSKATLYISSSVEINRSVKDARESFTITLAANKVGMFMGQDIRLDKSPTSLKLGEQDYWATIKRGNTPVGNVVVVRQGTAVHSLLIVGLYFEDPQDLQSLLSPKIEKAKTAKAHD